VGESRGEKERYEWERKRGGVGLREDNWRE
jgi:hypothetical protein